ncbi:MAG: MFS transporter [Nitrososphaeraceae archaeon]
MNSTQKIHFSTQVLSLLLARIFYSANWFNIASIFYLIAYDLKQDISMLGLVTSSFIIGVGLFQVPAGIIAAKYGPDKLAIFGILLASFCALVTGLSESILQIAVLRFIVGVGMACFFGPSVILITKFLGRRSEGLGIGLINSAHAIGGIVGIFGWVVLAQLTGWRISLVISGTLGLLTGLILSISLSRTNSKSIPEDESLPLSNNEPVSDLEAKKISPAMGISMSGLRRTIFNKSLIILGITLLSFQAGSSIILTFIVFYLGGTLRIDYTIAGLIGSLNLVIALFSSPMFGLLYDRTKKAKKILIISGFAAAVSIWGMIIPSIYVILPSMIFSAIFLSAGFVVVYAEAKRTNTIQGLDLKYQTLAVSFVNGISLFGAFWIPFLFSFAAERFGFSIAWLMGGLIVLAFILPAFKLK